LGKNEVQNTKIELQIGVFGAKNDRIFALKGRRRILKGRRFVLKGWIFALKGCFLDFIHGKMSK